MMLETQKSKGLLRGCVVPLLTVAGVLAMCFIACLLLFNLNQASLQTGF